MHNLRRFDCTASALRRSRRVLRPDSPDGNQTGGAVTAESVLQLALVSSAVENGHILDKQTASAAYLVFLSRLHVGIDEVSVATPGNLQREKESGNGSGSGSGRVGKGRQQLNKWPNKAGEKVSRLACSPSSGCSAWHGSSMVVPVMATKSLGSMAKRGGDSECSTLMVAQALTSPFSLLAVQR